MLLDGESSARNLKNWRIAEKLRKFLSIHCRRCDNNFDVGPTLSDFLQNTEEHVCVQASLVSFVHDDCTICLKITVVEAFSQEHTICHVLDDRMAGSAILKPDGVTDCVA